MGYGLAAICGFLLIGLQAADGRIHIGWLITGVVLIIAGIAGMVSES